MKCNLTIYTNMYIIVFLSFVQLESADLQILRSGNANTILNATTITESGNYILGRDITGPIIIAANDVYIDLKNFIIDGGINGISIDGFSGIKICNGSICNTIAEGILINTCSNVCIDNIETASCQLSGIKTISSSNISVLNSMLNSNNIANNMAHAGFFDQDSTRSFICNVKGSGNQQAAIFIEGTANQSIIRSSVLNDNPGFGIRISGTGVENQLIENCVANNNGDTGIGASQAHDILVVGCTCNNNGANGILFNMVIDGVIKKNIANLNTSIGISIMDSFIINCVNNITNNNSSIGVLFNMVIDGVIKKNIADLNTPSGIFINDSTIICCVNNITNNNNSFGIVNQVSDASFFLNKAQRNGAAGTSNYSGVNLVAVYDISMGMFTTGPATAFDNISVVP